MDAKVMMAVSAFFASTLVSVAQELPPRIGMSVPSITGIDGIPIPMSQLEVVAKGVRRSDSQNCYTRLRNPLDGKLYDRLACDQNCMPPSQSFRFSGCTVF